MNLFNEIYIIVTLQSSPRKTQICLLSFTSCSNFTPQFQVTNLVSWIHPGTLGYPARVRSGTLGINRHQYSYLPLYFHHNYNVHQYCYLPLYLIQILGRSYEIGIFYTKSLAQYAHCILPPVEGSHPMTLLSGPSCPLAGGDFTPLTYLYTYTQPCNQTWLVTMSVVQLGSHLGVTIGEV